MKKRYIVSGTGTLFLLCIATVGQYQTHLYYEKNLAELSSITKGVSANYSTEKTSLFSKQGTLKVAVDHQVKFEGEETEPLVFRFSTSTIILPFYTRTLLSPLDEESKKYFKSFKVDKAQLSTFFTKGEFLITSQKDEKAEMNVSMFGIDKNVCNFINGKAYFEKAEQNYSVTFNASDFSCSQKLLYRKDEMQEVLKINDLKLSTTLNRIFDKNFNLKAPDYFSLSMEKFSMNIFGSQIKLKAVDLNRSAIGDGSKESVYINLFIDQGAVVSRLNIQGVGDRYTENEKGIKTGKYHSLMQGPFFVQLPLIHKMYNRQLLSKTKNGLETNLHYSIDTDKVNLNHPSLSGDAIKLSFNGHDISTNELFSLLYQE